MLDCNTIGGQMKITKEVAEMLKTEEGCQKLTALKLCELVELMKNTEIRKVYRPVSMWESIFGHKGNE